MDSAVYIEETMVKIRRTLLGRHAWIWRDYIAFFEESYELLMVSASGSMQWLRDKTLVSG